MFDLKVLVVKLRFVVYTKASRPIAPNEVTTLHHKLGDPGYQPRASPSAESVVATYTRWKIALLYPCGCPLTLCSPVHNWRKFSAVLGTISSNNSILTRPAGVSPMLMSKKTTGRVWPSGASGTPGAADI